MPSSPLHPSKTESVADQLRLAMRGVAASVCVVGSADRSGYPHAMTATSIISLSLDPPSLLVCVNQLASVHTAIIESNAFSVSVLTNTQQEIAEQCSLRELTDGYLSRAPWQQDEKGIPYLPDGHACVFCALDRTIEYSTHSIFVGLVSHTYRQNDIAPLIYFDGSYYRHGPALADENKGR